MTVVTIHPGDPQYWQGRPSVSGTDGKLVTEEDSAALALQAWGLDTTVRIPHAAYPAITPPDSDRPVHCVFTLAGRPGFVWVPDGLYPRSWDLLGRRPPRPAGGGW